MKKFSVNLLKVSLLLILGLCIFSTGSEVNAAYKKLRTYYACPGQEITIKKSTSGSTALKENETFVLLYKNINNSADGTVSAYIKEVNLAKEECKISIPYGVEVNRSYYYFSYTSLFHEYCEIYIMPKHILTDAQGNTSISMKVGESKQIKFKYEKENQIRTIGSIVYEEEKNNYTKDSSVKFTSSAPSIVSVDNNGNLTAKKVGGPVTITMTRTIQQNRYVDKEWHRAKSTFTESIQVIVADAKTQKIAISLSAPKLTNNTKTMTLKVIDEKGKDISGEIAWSFVKGNDIAELSSNKGKTVTLTAKNDVQGKVKIKATYNSLSCESAEIEVNTKKVTGTLTTGNKLKYTYSSEGWNVHSSKKLVNENVVGEIVKDNVVEVTAVSGKWVAIKYDGGTGYIYYDNTAKGRFVTADLKTDITGIEVADSNPKKDSGDDPVTNPELPGLEGGDLGETANGIMSIVKMLLGWLTEFLASINWAEVAGTVMDIGGGLMGMISGVISN